MANKKISDIINSACEELKKSGTNDELINDLKSIDFKIHSAICLGVYAGELWASGAAFTYSSFGADSLCTREKCIELGEAYSPTYDDDGKICSDVFFNDLNRMAIKTFKAGNDETDV